MTPIFLTDAELRLLHNVIRFGQMQLNGVPRFTPEHDEAMQADYTALDRIGRSLDRQRIDAYSSPHVVVTPNAYAFFKKGRVTTPFGPAEEPLIDDASIATVFIASNMTLGNFHREVQNAIANGLNVYLATKLRVEADGVQRYQLHRELT